MNKWVGIGRVTAEPQVSMTQGGTRIARYTLAVNRMKKQDGTQEADFINCVCFNKTADFADRYLTKGTKIAVIGRIQTGSYEKDGRKVYTTDIVVDEHEFCESKGNNQQQTQATAALEDFSSIADPEGDLPF
jgi:single-strand DNA-binding protein